MILVVSRTNFVSLTPLRLDSLAPSTYHHFSLEDGSVRPFNAVIYTPRDSNAVAIYNTATLEYPLVAGVEVESYDRQESGSEIGVLAERFSNPERARTVQGGAVYTEPFDAAVEGVTVFLTTEGRPLNARIEL